VAIIPHILTAADVFDRVYKLIRRIQSDRVESRNKDLQLLQSDIQKLGEVVELQTRLMQERDEQIVNLTARLEKLESRKKFLFW
jgi:polyhydroxyalkanoate synthesis regulator phasin